MNIVIRTLRWTDASRVCIDTTLDGVIEGQTIPFTYDPSDTAPVTLAVKELLAAHSYDVLPPAKKG